MIKEKDIIITKSNFCLASQCHKLYWLSINKPDLASEIANEQILDNGIEVGLIAKDIFGPHCDIEYNSNISKMVEETKKLLELDNVVITEASFIYDNNFCSVDILIKKKNNYEIYEVKSSTDIKDIFIEDISFQYFVLNNLGLNVTKAKLIYLNSRYVRCGNLDLKKLFIIKNVTDEVINRQKKVSKKINIMKQLSTEDEPTIDLGEYCKDPYDCPFFSYCTKDLNKNNVFNIKRMKFKKKLELYNKGLTNYEDLIYENLNPKYINQMDYELNNKEPHIDKNKISEFLNTLSYPLYFLDFETFQQAIPKYDGINPYMQIPFQYSLHYLEHKDGKLYHKEFLADANIDPRRKLAETLVKDIPLNVCTLAYNMSFEKTVIKNLANLYPDLKDHLMNIHDNIKDLMLPFYHHDYYTKDMQGSYSIKYVLPALFPNEPSLNYHNLDLVHNGSEAMNAYATLGTLSTEEQKLIRKNLLKYCELDTYAMVKIWKKLEEIVQSNE